MTAIHIAELGYQFGTRVNLKHTSPGQLARGLLALLGFNVALQSANDVQTTTFVNAPVLNDICLDIARGSVVCFVGPTGAGKSALLKILSGVVAPSKGSVKIRGVISSLLKVGDNVDKRLSALENIENQRRLQKIPQSEAASYARDVIEFAELSGFEASVVRTYSTGMMMRLSVALALQGNPDIVLMDDVLGVGDLAFQHKFVERLHEMKLAGSTMLLALSDDNLIRELATRVVTLAGGRIVDDGPPSPFAGETASVRSDVSWQISDYLPENDAVALHSIDAVRREEDGKVLIDVGFDFSIKICPQQCRPIIDIFRGKIAVFRSVSPQDTLISQPGRARAVVCIPAHLLPPGDYVISPSIVSVCGRTVYSLKAPGAMPLAVKRSDKMRDETFPFVTAALPWEIASLAG
jgi:ABC-type polysaccharide/polyol phosphate transport system ATPase subunit